MLDIAITCVRDSKGKFLVLKRASDKKTFPSHYIIGSGGKRDPGEDIQQTVVRETEEELGIIAQPKYLFSVDCKSIGMSQCDHIFELNTEEEITMCPREFESMYWLEVSEIDLIDQQRKLCPDTSLWWKEYKQRYLS